MIERDRNLDMYRALTLIYIVCVIHVSYWLPFHFEPYKGLLLWEMPAIFFIAGASAQLSRKKSVKEQVKSRCKRVLIPYYIYAFSCLLLLLIVSLLPFTANAIDYKLFDYGISDFLSVLLARGIPGVPMVRHLWFILPYMLVSSSFPLQRQLAERYRWKYLLLCFFVFACFSFILKHSPVDFSQYHWLIMFVVLNCSYFLCYNVFFIAGFLYYRKLRKSQVLAVLSVSLLVLIFLSNGKIPDMQVEKFPPSVIFVSFGTVWLCLLSLIFHNCPFPKGGRIMDRWNKYGFTMYMYQNFAFLFFHFTVAKFLSRNIGWGVLGFVISVFSLFVISTILSYLTIPYEGRMYKLLTGFHKRIVDI